MFRVFALIALSVTGICREILELPPEAKAFSQGGDRGSRWIQTTPADKARVIEELRVIKSGWPPNRARDEAHVALLNLGHPVTISETMRLYKGRYRARRGMSFHLKRTNQLLLIPLLAEDLASQEEIKTQFYENEFWDFPRPVTSSRMICQILINAPDVSPAVKE